MTTSKAVTQVAKQEVQILDQVYLDQLQNEYADSIDVRKEIIRTPKLKLCNALSDGVKSGLGKLGDFVCNEAQENLGPSISIIPLITGESASLLQQKSSTVICSSRDMIKNREGVLCKNCPHGEYWNDWKNKVPGCKTSIDMIVLLYHSASKEVGISPMVLNFRKNNYKAGRKIVEKIFYNKVKLPFAYRYTISSRLESANKQDWYAIDSNKIDCVPLTQEEIQQTVPWAKRFIEMKRSGKIDIVDEGEAHSVKDEEDNLPL